MCHTLLSSANPSEIFDFSFLIGPTQLGVHHLVLERMPENTLSLIEANKRELYCKTPHWIRIYCPNFIYQNSHSMQMICNRRNIIMLWIEGLSWVKLNGIREFESGSGSSIITGGLSMDFIREFMCQLMEALQYVHQRGVRVRVQCVILLCSCLPDWLLYIFKCENVVDPEISSPYITAL